MKQRQYAVLLIAPAFLALMLLLLTAPTAQADSTPQPLPFAQDWSNTGLITGNDIWIGVPGIVGYLGDFLPSSSPTGVNPQTVLTDTAASAVDVIANQTNPNTLTAGGVAEFDTLANPVVALQGSGTADAPFVQVNLNTTDKKNIVVVYKLRDVDGAADNAIQPVALHYRIGSVGSFTNVPAAFVADATSGPSLATLVTPVTVTLPSTANNQALVQIRILTTNAASSDEWVGIDDISVTGSPLDTPPTISSTTPISGATGVPTTTAPITLNFSEPVTATAGAITLECPAGSPITLSGLPASGASITVTPTVALPDFTICKVSALAANITDQDGTPDQLDGNGDGTGGDDYAFTFRTIAPGDPAPEVVSTMPISGATNVLVSANVAITFSEPLTVTTATFTITCASSGAHSVTLNGGPVGFTLNPDADFARSELCTVTVLAAQVSDQDAIDPPDNMVADYTFSFTTQPPDAAPAVVATSPISGATNVPINASIVVTFSEPVSATSASFAVNCPAPVGFTLSGGPTKFTLGNLVNGLCSSQYTVTVTAAAVTDLDNDDPPDAMAANYVFPFTMQPDPCTNTVTSISAIQGVTTTTPYAGQIVTTRGAVVGDYEGASPALRGFYIQDTGDGDPATSDGLFVFNASNNNVSVGQVVAVTGRAEEFESQTQIGGSVQVRVCPFGLVSPPADITLPIPAAVDGVPYLERFEGMLVRFPQTLYVTEHFQLGRFGQVVLTSNVDRLRQPTQIAAPGAPALAIQSANNLNRVILDDALYNQNPDPILYGRGGNPLSASNTLRAGDSAVDLVGVLSNSKATTEFAVNTTTNIITYRVRPTTNPDFQPTNPRPSAPETITGTVKVAAFNTLNFFNTFGSSCTNGVGGTTTSCRGASNSVEYSRQVSKTIPAMLGLDADVIGLMEIENDGYGSSSAIQEMVNRLNAATAPGTYALIDADALIGQVNVLGTDAIKVGLIYKPARVTPVGTTAALNTGAFGLFNTGAGVIGRSRPPLVQAFAQNSNGERFIVAVNHLKSKGSSCADNISPVGPDPDTGDGQGNCNLTRKAGAEELAAWLATNPTGTGDPDILIIGDMNSYALEDPITAIKNAGYTDLIASEVGANAYSLAFDGQWGYLDHALGSPSITPHVTDVTEWHINADEPSVLDYNTEFKSVGQQSSLFSADQYRASDHDSLIIGLNLVAPKLTVTKIVVNDSGGSKVVADFPLFVNGTPVTSGVTSTLNAGVYTVTETSMAGYTATFSGDCDASGKLTLTPGDVKSCTITNDDQPARLTVTKVVVNDNGGSKVVVDFPLFVNAMPVTSGVTSTLNAGVYTVTETNVAGYSATFSGDCDASGKLTLTPGDVKFCTITNDDQPAKLTVTKVVVNDNGGTKVVSDFPIFVNGTPVTSGVTSTLNAGVYTVTETSMAGYSATFSGDCDASGKLTLTPGDVKSCTITNDDQPAKLTVTKVVVNDNGGTKVVSDFPIFVNGTPVTSGVTSTLNAGVYTVTETSVAGYTATFSGDCDASGKLTLTPGDVKSCTITNDDQPAKLTVTKIVVNDSGGSKVVADFPLFVNGTPVTSGVTSTLNAGVYTVTETSMAGYTASFSGDCDASGKLTLSLGNVKSCTITNDDQPARLTVTKIVVNDNGGSKVVADFPLFVNAMPVTSGVTSTLNAGIYTVTETSMAGYSATFSGDCDASGKITLSAGDVKSCTITNDDQPAKLTVTKVVVNDNGGSKVVADFPLFVNGKPVTSGVTSTLNAGVYTVTETSMAGYSATFSGDCDASGKITLTPGDVKSCTITNDDQLIPPSQSHIYLPIVAR